MKLGLMIGNLYLKEIYVYDNSEIEIKLTSKKNEAVKFETKEIDLFKNLLKAMFNEEIEQTILEFEEREGE